jgi:hypothetical protein
MKANELIIGNWINADGQIKQADISDIENCQVVGHNKPIPLTEEWLVKFGFKKQRGVWVLDFMKSTQGLRGDLRSDGSFSLALDEKSLLGDTESLSLRTINFVHQLQNLYFALTGEEQYKLAVRKHTVKAQNKQKTQRPKKKGRGKR